MIFPRKKLILPCHKNGYLQSASDARQWRDRFKRNPLAKVAEMFVPKPLRMSPGYPCCCGDECSSYYKFEVKMLYGDDTCSCACCHSFNDIYYVSITSNCNGLFSYTGTPCLSTGTGIFSVSDKTITITFTTSDDNNLVFSKTYDVLPDLTGLSAEIIPCTSFPTGCNGSNSYLELTSVTSAGDDPTLVDECCCYGNFGYFLVEIPDSIGGSCPADNYSGSYICDENTSQTGGVCNAYNLDNAGGCTLCSTTNYSILAAVSLVSEVFYIGTRLYSSGCTIAIWQKSYATMGEVYDAVHSGDSLPNTLTNYSSIANFNGTNASFIMVEDS